MYAIERYHDFCAGHRVHGHESKCAHLHGHNYRVYFVVAPLIQGVERLDNVGRVVDFSCVKSTLCQWLEETWDHRFLVHTEDPLYRRLRALDFDGVLGVPFNPTAERMAEYLVTAVGPALLTEHNVRLIKCTVQETRKCAATYHLSP